MEQLLGTIRFGKSRGTSVGSDTVVQDGDELGVIVFADMVLIQKHKVDVIIVYC